MYTILCQINAPAHWRTPWWNQGVQGSIVGVSPLFLLVFDQFSHILSEIFHQKVLTSQRPSSLYWVTKHKPLKCLNESSLPFIKDSWSEKMPIIDCSRCVSSKLLILFPATCTLWFSVLSLCELYSPTSRCALTVGNWRFWPSSLLIGLIKKGYCVWRKNKKAFSGKEKVRSKCYCFYR